MTAASVRNAPTLPLALQVALTAVSATAAWTSFRAVIVTVNYDLPCGNPLMAVWFLATTAAAAALLIAAYDVTVLRRRYAVTTAHHWARLRLLLGGFALTAVATNVIGVWG